MTWRVLDLFCGAGGAAVGLKRAWPDAEIIGVDIADQPEYPFAFRRADAMRVSLRGYDFVWASPVCKGYSSLRSMRNVPAHRKLIGEVRARLEKSGCPFVIENVSGAVRDMRASIMLCGQMFGLKVFRHRWFESNVLLFQPPHLAHIGRTGSHRYPYSPINGFLQVTGLPGWNYKLAEAQAAMGIDWIGDAMIAQAIPPAYSAFIARQIRPCPIDAATAESAAARSCRRSE